MPARPVPLLASAAKSPFDRFLEWFTTDGIRILLVIGIAILLRWILFVLIRRILAASTSRQAARLSVNLSTQPIVEQHNIKLAQQRQTARMRTIGSLLRSITTVIIVLTTVGLIAAIVGVPLGPIVASAGIGGVAIGFGAQSLVRDYLSGLIMITENQFGVGDLVEVWDGDQTITGVVQEVTLRLTRVKDEDNVMWYIPNGATRYIGNKSQQTLGMVLATPDTTGKALSDDDARIVSATKTSATKTSASKTSASKASATAPVRKRTTSSRGGSKKPANASATTKQRTPQAVASKSSRKAPARRSAGRTTDRP